MTNIKNCYLQLRLLACLLALMSVPAIGAPITFNSALPISKGERIARGLVTVDRRSGRVDDTQLQRDQLSFVSVFGYGIDSKWSVFGVLPTTKTIFEFGDESQRETSIADTEIFSRYEILRIDKLGTTYRIAPFAGVRLPTGERGVSGDETTDFFAGLILTSASIEQNFDLQIRYDLGGRDGQFSAGDSSNFDLSWQKRVYPKKITANTKGFWFAVLETNLNHTQRNRFAGQSDRDSGGFIASLAPGVQYVTRRWIAELAVRIPIINNLNNTTLEPDYTVFTGLRANF